MTVLDVPLVEYEHTLALACMEMEREGLGVDVEYASGYLTEYLVKLETEAKERCADAGIKNINSTANVADVLLAHGAELTARTATGKLQVNSDVLDAVAAEGGAAAKIAKAVIDGKRASSFRIKYVDSVLSALDNNNRVHPSIASLQARTARMSVSEPPFHQLPSDDYLIRREIVAAEGHVLLAIDYAQIELRVLAALSRDKRMIQAFINGEDMHQVTADACGVSRKVGKMTNFLIVYGGGAKKLSVSAGIPFAQAKRVIATFKRTFPGVARLAKRIQDEFHAGKRYVTTPVGRHLPIDRQRVYGGLNYLIQSTARDVLGQAMVNIREAGQWHHAILPIHDELLLEVPVEDAEEVGQFYADTMRINNFLGTGVDLLTDVSEPVPSWGHLYLKEGELMPA